MKKIWTSKEFMKHSKAGILNRRSTLVITIDRLLEKYETIPKNENIEKQFILAILSACNNYLEYASIKKPKGSKKQASVETLRQQVLARLDEILLANIAQSSLLAQKRLLARERWSMLASIFNGKGKMMNEDCWREVVKPHFAGGDFTRGAFEEWKSGSSDKKFVEWLDKEYIPCILASASPSIKDRWIANKIQSTKVEYLSEVERKSKEITVQDGTFFNHLNQKYDTQNISTAFSGNGWGIFVMDGNHKIYVGSHQAAEFHHSSFLSGGRALAAGELAIKNGQLTAISNRSGHYRPSEKNFYAMLFFLHDHGVRLRNIPAIINFDKPVRYFDAYQVMLNGGGSQGLTEIAPPPVQASQGSTGYLQPIASHRQAPPPPVQVPQRSTGYLEPIASHRQAPPPPMQASQGSIGYLEPIIKKHNEPPHLSSMDEIYWDLFHKF